VRLCRVGVFPSKANCAVEIGNSLVIKLPQCKPGSDSCEISDFGTNIPRVVRSHKSGTDCFIALAVSP
jgi:hypothetical protein